MGSMYYNVWQASGPALVQVQLQHGMRMQCISHRMAWVGKDLKTHLQFQHFCRGQK